MGKHPWAIWHSCSINIYTKEHERKKIIIIHFIQGAVYLYHIPTDKDWDCLDIATPTRVIQTSHEHIHSLVIGDDGDGPFVTIATEGYSILIVQYKRHNFTLHSMTSHVREW